MKFTEANLGRIFILRLEHGDRIPDVIEEFANGNNIDSATVLFVGGSEQHSKVVVGPEDGTVEKPVPTVVNLGLARSLSMRKRLQNYTCILLLDATNKQLPGVPGKVCISGILVR